MTSAVIRARTVRREPAQHPEFILPTYHPNVVIGETYTFGFNGTYTGVYDHAYAFRLAGTLCDVIYN